MMDSEDQQSTWVWGKHKLKISTRHRPDSQESFCPLTTQRRKLKKGLELSNAYNPSAVLGSDRKISGAGSLAKHQWQLFRQETCLKGVRQEQQEKTRDLWPPNICICQHWMCVPYLLTNSGRETDRGRGMGGGKGKVGANVFKPTDKIIRLLWAAGAGQGVLEESKEA